MTASTIKPGKYNDTKVSIQAGNIIVQQNPVMFVVLAVLAIIIAAVFFFLAGKGEMTINNIVIPPAVAKIVSIGISILFVVAAGISLLQAKSPATLLINTQQKNFTRNGGIVGAIFARPVRSGTFADFKKIVLAYKSTQDQQGKKTEYWQLSLHLHSGEVHNLGSFGKQDEAKQLATAFAAELNTQLEEC